MAQVKHVYEVRFENGEFAFVKASDTKSVRSYITGFEEFKDLKFKVTDRTKAEAKNAIKDYNKLVQDRNKLVYPNTFGRSTDARKAKEQDEFNTLVENIRTWSVGKEVQWREFYLVVVFEMSDGSRYEYVENRTYRLPYSLTKV